MERQDERSGCDVWSFDPPKGIQLCAQTAIARNPISEHRCGNKSLVTGRMLALRTSMNGLKPGTMVPSAIVDRRGSTHEMTDIPEVLHR
jgi:hypothetical protein